MNIYYENSHHVCFGLCMVNIDILGEMVELFVGVISEGYVVDREKGDFVFFNLLIYRLYLLKTYRFVY